MYRHVQLLPRCVQTSPKTLFAFELSPPDLPSYSATYVTKTMLGASGFTVKLLSVYLISSNSSTALTSAFLSPKVLRPSSNWRNWSSIRDERLVLSFFWTASHNLRTLSSITGKAAGFSCAVARTANSNIATATKVGFTLSPSTNCGYASLANGRRKLHHAARRQTCAWGAPDECVRGYTTFG